MNNEVWWAYTAISRHVLKSQFLIYLTYEHTSAAYLQVQTN
jgi:hypothetical protein